MLYNVVVFSERCITDETAGKGKHRGCYLFNCSIDGVFLKYDRFPLVMPLATDKDFCIFYCFLHFLLEAICSV